MTHKHVHQSYPLLTIKSSAEVILLHNHLASLELCTKTFQICEQSRVGYFMEPSII